MSHETAVWTLLACLLAAAVIGFAVAWTIQHWRIREGARLAADLEASHTRLQAAHDHLGTAAEHERTARVQADQRIRDLNDELLAARIQFEETVQSHQGVLERLQGQLVQITGERDHLQQRLSETIDHDAVAAHLREELSHLERAHTAGERALRAAEAERDEAIAELRRVRLDAASHATAEAEAHARLATLQQEHEEGQRELLQLRTRLGAASQQTLELEHTINRMQMEALAQQQAHAQAVQAAEAAAAGAPTNAFSEEDQRISQRLDAQRVQELEDQLRKVRLVASDYRLEAAGLKSRVADLEQRLHKLYAPHQDAGAAASLTETKAG